jgi:DNA-3-methyladenine glycosylase I
MLILEGAQAGLSWRTILSKRQAYRAAFDDFEVDLVARYTAGHIARLLQNSGIVRNRLKVTAAVANAQRFLDVQGEFGSFAAYIWRFTDGKSVVNRWRSAQEVPAHTTDSDRMSRDLSARGFKFVGTTICYAFMQSIGMVNDHLMDCFRHREIQRLTERRS